MYETPETNIEPTTSDSDKQNQEELPTVDAPDGNPVAPIVIENVNVPETVIMTPTIVQSADTKLEEIKIVAVASAATDETIGKIINDEQEAESKSIKSVNKSESESGQVKSYDDRNETRVISLDTIIRKGLNEQMPMTAKDIDNIVPNAIKQQQDASLKQSEKLANEKLASEKEFALVYESSDDYQSSDDDKFDDDVDVNTKEPDEQKANDQTVISESIETTDDNKQKNVPPELKCETVLEEKLPSAADASTATDLPIKDADEKQATQLNETNDSCLSDFSIDDESESDSTNSLHKKQKRRKITTGENKVEDKKEAEEHGGTGDDVGSDPGPRLNRRGKPRKSYDESDSDQVKKKVGRKMKGQRYAMAKRPGVRVSKVLRDDISIPKYFPLLLNPCLCSSCRDDRNVMMG